MKLGTFVKQPRERVVRAINYNDALSENDNLLPGGATVIVTPADASFVVDQISVTDDGRVRFWSAGGVDGTYLLTFTVVTLDGVIFEDEIIFKVKEIV